MARREANIDGIRLYSDNLDGDKNKASKTFKSYKKVEKTTTTKTVTKSGSNPSQTVVTKTKTKFEKDYGVPRKSLGTISPHIKEMAISKQGTKEKYMYAGKLKEKENYLYYVSGIGYVNKDGVPVKQDNKPKEIKVLSNKPKPTREVGQRVTITLQNTRPERKGGELIENFEYHETKEFGKNNKESVVVHRRLGDPFYQAIKGQRSSSYQGQRPSGILGKNQSDTKITSKTIETKSIQNKQYGNKTYNTTKTTKTTTQSYAGKGNKNINTSAYQKTINVEERKRNIMPKPRIEKTFTQTKRAVSQEQKKYIPSQKKYQEKSDESFRKTTQTQKTQNKVFDTEKYKRNVNTNVNTNIKTNINTNTKTNVNTNANINAKSNIKPNYKANITTSNINTNINKNVNANIKTGMNSGMNTGMNSGMKSGMNSGINAYQSKYQQKTEETQKTEYSQDQNLMNDPNYCPIHGYHGEIENYKFYESKNLSSRVQTNINTQNINTQQINTQHIVNSEENMNCYNSMNQEQMAQGEEAYDMSKLYIATKVTPVYSEMFDQQFQGHSHVCNVCGNPFDENCDMMQQNQMSSMQEVEYDINCPIHGHQHEQ